MRFPKYLKIAGIKYHILLENLENEEAAGNCNTQTKIIKLCKKANKNRGDYLHTLTHEVVHAVWEEYSISQTGIPEQVEEILANSLANVIIKNFILQFNWKELEDE